MYDQVACLSLRCLLQCCMLRRAVLCTLLCVVDWAENGTIGPHAVTPGHFHTWTGGCAAMAYAMICSVQRSMISSLELAAMLGTWT